MVDYKKYILYSILIIFLILLIIAIILGIINSINEHEFISDLTSIKFTTKNEFIGKLCGIDNCKKSTSQKCKNMNYKYNNIYSLNPVLSDIINILLSKIPYGSIPEDTCTTKQLNNFNKYFSFSKVEAKQILLNNQLLIDQIYGNKKSKKYIKDILNIIKKLLKYYPTPADFEHDINISLKQIDKDYKELSFNDQKNIDIVLAEIFMVELLNISNPISLIGDIGPIKS